MFQNILSLFVNIFNSVGSWFATLFSSVPGALAFVTAMFIVFLSLRVFLRPLIGSTPAIFHENRRLLSKAKGER